MTSKAPSLAGAEVQVQLLLQEIGPELRGHSERVAALCGRLGTALGLAADELQALRLAALLHDVGKHELPAAVLEKPGPLTQAEWRLIRLHPELGLERTRQITGLPDAVHPAILAHHERWDGHGYPHGLRGENIPRLARILAVCDVFDALRSVRPYKPAWSPETALAEVRREREHAFDPCVVDVFLVMHQLDSRASHWPHG